MINKTEIKKIGNKLIKKSFPILRGKKIHIYYFSKGDLSGRSLWILPFFRILFINKNRKFSKEELIGLLAHELCHFETYQKRGWVKTFSLGLKYSFSSNFRKKEEYTVDKLAIQKNYARNIYKQRVLRWNSIDKNHKLKRVYMPPTEIKKYAKKIGKW